MGIGTGIIGSLGYWIDQQEVMRGGQPWYYFLLLVPLYEFLPLLLAGGGVVAVLLRRSARVSAAQAPGGDGMDTQNEPPSGAGPDGAIGDAQPASVPALDVGSLFLAFLVFWVFAVWVVFTYVGEKMPWHVVYFTTPMALLGGWWLGRVIEGINWRLVWARGGLWVLAAVPVFLLALKAIIPIAGHRPFVDTTMGGLSNTFGWVAAALVGAVVLWLAGSRMAALGRDQSLRLLALSVAALLGIYTAGVAYRFAFINYDYPTEPMVYAHGTPDLKLAMSQVEQISRKTAGGYDLKIAYDSSALWPLEWYLRDYGNRVYYGDNPSREALDAPVVIVGDTGLDKAKPYLGSRYYNFKYRLIWWPRQTYWDLNWQRIWDGIRDPKTRGLVWDVILNRRYTTSTAAWEPPYVRNFYLFVRKDIADQVWPYGPPPADASAVAASSDPYAKGVKDIPAVQVLGTAGVSGSAAGQLDSPRAVAVGSDGTLYVADTGNNRIEEFSPQGQFIRAWGSTCKLIENNQGCVGNGQGQFNEPWGIAVGSDGSVYVSDTWNSRVQKFDREGRFQTMWGVFQSTNGALSDPGAMYGPRAVAVGQDGLVYVMDTGNKRVQSFKPDGTFVAQYGGGGVTDGTFDEPVGLAQDASGNWYVTDTWNHRVQKFDAGWNYLSQWPIAGWASQSVVNKPYVTVDGKRGLVYVTDPEGYRVLVFGLDGTFKGTWGQFGQEANSFTLPTGLALDAQGRVVVADGGSHRIMTFPPWQ
jgi:DNA-binding beta-propeller fold protein YncE